MYSGCPQMHHLGIWGEESYTWGKAGTEGLTITRAYLCMAIWLYWWLYVPLIAPRDPKALGILRLNAQIYNSYRKLALEEKLYLLFTELAEF